MASVRSSNPYEGDNGLHCIEYYANFASYTGNNLWINYELSMTTSMAVKDLENSFPYSQPAPEYLFASSITNGRIFVDTSTSGEAYKMFQVNGNVYGGGSYNRLYNFKTAYTGGSTYWVAYKSCINNGFYRYNAHIYNNKIDFYINGNYYSTMSLASKYFCFTMKSGAKSTTMTKENNYIRYITLTDKMTNVVPKPPYSLDEKNNELYGYKK